MRRDLINAEIANLRDLLPLPQSTRQRLSQLQLMALVCVYVRKANYFQQGKFAKRQPPAPNRQPGNWCICMLIIGCTLIEYAWVMSRWRLWLWMWLYCDWDCAAAKIEFAECSGPTAAIIALEKFPQIMMGKGGFPKKLLNMMYFPWNYGPWRSTVCYPLRYDPP